MASDSRTLSLQIHANTEIAREQLQSLVGVVGSTAQQVDARLADMESKFASVGRGISSAKAALIGFVGGFAGGMVQQLPSILINAAKTAMDYASSVGDVSQQLGIGAEFLQEYRFAATQSGASTEQADEAMRRFGVTTGKAADGNKRAAASFKAVGVDIANTNGKLKPTEQLFQEVATAISKVEDPARRVAYATALFGENGSRILPVLEAGTDGFNKFADAARALGLVIDQDTINQLDGLEGKMAAIKQVISTQMAVAIASNADAIIALGNAAGGAIGQIARFAREVRGLAVLNEVKGFSPSGFTMEQAGTPAGEKAVREGEIRDLQQQLRAKKASSDPNSIFSFGPSVAQLEDELASQRKALAEFLASPEYQAAARAGIMPSAGGTAGGNVIDPPEKAGKTKKAKAPYDFTAAIADMPKIGLAFDDAGNSVDKLMSKLDGTGKSVEEIVTDTLSLSDALKLLKIPPLIDEEQQRRIEQFGEDLSNNVGQALIYGQSLGPALVNSFKAAAAEAVSSQLFELLTGGKGGGGGLIGGLLGGAAKILRFADGGDPPIGQWSLVGERGPELIRPRSAMNVIPNHKLPRIGGGGSDTRQQNMRVEVDVTASPLLLVATRRVAEGAAAEAATSALGRALSPGIGRL